MSRHNSDALIIQNSFHFLISCGFFSSLFGAFLQPLGTDFGFTPKATQWSRVNERRNQRQMLEVEGRRLGGGGSRRLLLPDSVGCWALTPLSANQSSSLLARQLHLCAIPSHNDSLNAWLTAKDTVQQQHVISPCRFCSCTWLVFLFKDVALEPKHPLNFSIILSFICQWCFSIFLLFCDVL